RYDHNLELVLRPNTKYNKKHAQYNIDCAGKRRHRRHFHLSQILGRYLRTLSLDTFLAQSNPCLDDPLFDIASAHSNQSIRWTVQVNSTFHPIVWQWTNHHRLVPPWIRFRIELVKRINKRIGHYL